jgi:hypothetical protein
MRNSNSCFGFWWKLTTAPAITNATEEYDGTSWTAGGNLGTARRGLASAGTQTVAAGFGGFTTVVVTNTEEYDGTSHGQQVET